VSEAVQLPQVSSTSNTSVGPPNGTSPSHQSALNQIRNRQEETANLLFMRSLVPLDLPLQEVSDRPNIMEESNDEDEDEDDAETTSINESDTGSQEL
jgi:hypothetical protein